jgi:hypothetical protein
MVVWGGDEFSAPVNTGGRYTLASDSWTPTTTSGAPTVRTEFAGVWSGTELIVWGGFAAPSVTNRGGRYNPSTDSWIETMRTGAPAARKNHTAVWTGTEMIVWGGRNADGTVYYNTGGRFDPP